MNVEDLMANLGIELHDIPTDKLSTIEVKFWCEGFIESVTDIEFDKENNSIILRSD